MSKKIVWWLLIALWVCACTILQEGMLIELLMVIILLIPYRIWREHNKKMANIFRNLAFIIALLPIVVLIQKSLNHIL